jgi:hypothetical protein
MTTQCPACLRPIDVRTEKVALRAEVLCPECGAMLAILSRDPLHLIEVDLVRATEEN